MTPKKIRKVIRGTVATYPSDGGGVCDVRKVAAEYSKIGNIPEGSCGFSRAAELARLCREFISLYDRHLKQMEKRK